MTKLEPPNWWIDFVPDLELTITGNNFENARIGCSQTGVAIVRSKVTGGGHYMFVWLKIEPSAPAGPITFNHETQTGKTSVNFSLERRSSSSGKFQGFSQDDVIYLIMPDRFADGDPTNDEIASSPGAYDRSKPRAYHGGDLRGILEHLDYLRDLGVTTIWLTPIVENAPESPQDYHGYGAVDEYAVEQHFGTLKDLQDVVSSAHSKGMKMILDFVPNHVGPRHPWADAPPEPDWFHGTKDHHTNSSGEFRYLADPHAPPHYWRDAVDGWFADILPDLNQENPDVAQYFTQNALWWAEETGIDGYRLDTFPYVSLGFWSQWHQALRNIYPNITTVGEVFNRDPDVTSFFAGGRTQFDGIDSGVSTVFDFPAFSAFRDVISGEATVQTIIDVLSRDRLYPHPELLVPFLGNHDVRRLASLPDMSAEKLKLAFSVLLTMRGIPEIYYGDEIGMTGGDDPDNRRDFPGGFPGDARDAFLESGRTPQQQELFSHVQHLLALRRVHPSLRGGELWNIFWNRTAYAFARISKDERVLVVVNFSRNAQSMEFSLSGTPLAGASRLVPLFGGSPLQIQNDRVSPVVPADGVQMYLVTQ